MIVINNEVTVVPLKFIILFENVRHNNRFIIISKEAINSREAKPQNKEKNMAKTAL